MAKAKKIDEATVLTAQGIQVAIRAMDDGSLAVVAPAGTTAWSVVSLFSGDSGTRLRLVPRVATSGEDADDIDA